MYYSQFGDENRGHDANVSGSDDEYGHIRRMSLSEKLAKVAKGWSVPSDKQVSCI